MSSAQEGEYESDACHAYRFRSTIDGLYYKDEAIIKRSHPFSMLPHSLPCEAVVIISIILHIHMVCITFTFSQTFRKDTFYYVFAYLLELIYFLYLMFTIIHRQFSIHKQDYCSNKMPFVHLVIGIVTIIPYYSLYQMIWQTNYSVLTSHSLQLVVVFRLCHVILFFARKRTACGLNRILLIVIETLSINSIYICIFSCVVGWLGCYGCEFSNWTTHQKDNLYDYTNFRQRLIYPMVLIGSLLLGNYSGFVIPETIPEISTVLFTMLVGLVLKIAFMRAQFISEYISYYWKHNWYKIWLLKIRHFIALEELNRSLKNDILDYFNVLWGKRAGVRKLDPEYMQLLPHSLQNEIKMDLGWDVLSHSHFFRDASLSVKTTVASLMHNRFMRHGDVIYDTGDLKVGLIYIVSGIVQLLSDEDDESPIMSFTSGTVISEFSCLMLGWSHITLRCASYCELRVLNLNDFYRGMEYYIGSVRDFQAMLRKRIDSARLLHGRFSVVAETARPIRRVKLQWLSIFEGKEGEPVTKINQTSEYMDLLALGAELDLKVSVICLTSKFPLIMEPESSFRYFTEFIVIAVCVIQATLIPYCAAFSREISPALRSFFIFLDIVYVLDIYLQVTTAVVENNILIVKFTTILIHRIKEISFLVDVLAIVPIDYIYWAQGCSPRLFIMLKVPRLLKIYKSIKIIWKFQISMININGLFVLLLKHSLRWLVCVYFFTCLLYITSCYNPECVPFSWYQYNMELMNLTESQIYPFTTSLLCAVDLLSSARKNFYSYDFTDSFISLIIIIIGYYVMPTATAQIVANYYWKMQETAANKIFISSVMNYAHIHKLMPALVVRITRLLEFRWTHNRGLFNVSAGEFIDEMPLKLADRVREDMIGTWLDAQELFHGLEEQVRRRVLQVAQLTSYPEDAKIIRSGELVANLYIIKRGTCSVVSEVPGDFERKTNKYTLGSGSSFPIVEVLQAVPSFLTVMALTVVDAIVIPYEVFIRVVKCDRLYYASLLEALQLHMATYSITLLRSERRMNYVAFKKAIVGTYFQYEINDNLEPEEVKLNILMTTINPHSRLYITYEVLHCVVVIFQFLILILQMNVLYEYRNIIDKLNTTCDLLNWMDILIRLRLHYYKSDGILITDFKSVMKYYITHAFVLDMYASCPISTLSVEIPISSYHPIVIKHFLLLLSRPLQLYRVFRGISYMCHSTKIISEANTARIECVLLVLVIIPLGSNFLVLSVCTVDLEQEFSCPMNGWQGGDITEITTMTSLAHYSFITALYLNGNPFNHFAGNSNFTYGIYIFFTLISLPLGWLLVSKLITIGLLSQFTTLQVQNDRTYFQKFAKIEGINPTMTDRVLQVNAFLTRDTGSYIFNETAKRLSTQLKKDALFAMNEMALRSTAVFFDVPECILQVIASAFERRFFMKDDIIIRNNDINSCTYIVNTGRVAVFLAGCDVAILNRGGMFGCISNQKSIRQTIDAVATMHTEALCIETAVLNRYIYPYESVKTRMRKLININTEYVEPIPCKLDEEMVTNNRVTLIPNQPTTENIKKSVYSSLERYRIFYHFMDMHLSTFSVMFILIYIMVAMQENVTTEFYVILYVLDAFFVLKIVMGFVLPFVDDASGLIIRNARDIARRYIRMNFWIDLLVVFPTELIFAWASSSQFNTALLTSNRLLRIIFLIRHYHMYRQEIRLTHFLRWVFYAYITVIFIQFFVDVWHYYACTRHKCRYRKFVSHDAEEYIPTLSETYGYFFSYTHVVNFFSSNGLKATKPLNVDEILVTLALVVASTFMTAFISSGYVFVQIIDNYYLGYYRNKLQDTRIHLVHLRLSPAIVEKLVYYYQFIWRFQHGLQWPCLISETRRYLHENIMVDLYSELIFKSYIFRNTHKDFIRQLLVHLKRMVYPRAMVIVEETFVDGKMYFIQSGSVALIEETGNGFHRKVCSLASGESFGEEQGLTNVPHVYTYITETSVVLLSLRKKDWEFLLEFFPASHETIAENLRIYFRVTADV